MAKHAFTREELELVLDEVDRRLDIEVREAAFEGNSYTLGEIKELRALIMQGVYGTLMKLASDWSGVVVMIDELKEGRVSEYDI